MEAILVIFRMALETEVTIATCNSGHNSVDSKDWQF